MDIYMYIFAMLFCIYYKGWDWIGNRPYTPTYIVKNFTKSVTVKKNIFQKHREIFHKVKNIVKFFTISIMLSALKNY